MDQIIDIARYNAFCELLAQPDEDAMPCRGCKQMVSIRDMKKREQLLLVCINSFIARRMYDKE